MAGICNHASFHVELLSSDNDYLTYPCKGTIILQETGTDGSIINAVFRKDVEGIDDSVSTFVSVRNPVFTYKKEKDDSPIRQLKTLFENAGRGEGKRIVLSFEREDKIRNIIDKLYADELAKEQ